MTQNDSLTLGIIGTGNMGTALLEGALQSGVAQAGNVYAFDVAEDQLRELAGRSGINQCSSAVEVVEASEVILLAVKPQNLPAIREELEGKFREGQLVVSILAGVPVTKLRQALGEGPAIVRTMPNLPALVGKGVTAVAEGVCDDKQMKLVKSILGTVGEVVVLPEELMDSVTALSGSGPGFVYLLVEAMAEAGEATGLPREAARTLARQTFIGACALLEGSDEEPEELRRRVTSPGGTTEAGIKMFEQLGLRNVFKKALTRSAERSKELGRG